MNNKEMGNLIMELLFHDNEECGTETQVKNVRTFSEMGILTKNDGFVVRMQDGSEFQITIVQSK